MSKRARGGSVTGGTGDIKPQLMTLSAGLAGAVADYVTDRVSLPVPRFGTMKTKATIVELLWVDWYMAYEDFSDTTNLNWGFLSTTTLRTDGETSTSATLRDDILDPRTFALAIQTRNLTTSGSSSLTMPVRINLTDMNGNGILIATDSLTVTGGNVGGTAVGSYSCKVAYRMVNVGVAEYVGIVQSQQAT